MKLSDNFDAKRLRPRTRRSWGARLLALLGALLVVLGALLLLAGAAALIGHHPALAELQANRLAAGLVIACGLLALWLGLRLWRRGRRRPGADSSLGMSRHLLK